MKVSINISVYFHPILDVTGSTPSEVGSPPSGEHSFVLFSTSDTERKARSKGRQDQKRKLSLCNSHR